MLESNLGLKVRLKKKLNKKFDFSFYRQIKNQSIFLVSDKNSIKVY